CHPGAHLALAVREQALRLRRPPCRRSRPDAGCRLRRAARVGNAEAPAAPAAAILEPARPPACDGSNAQADGTLNWFRKKESPMAFKDILLTLTSYPDP